MDKRDDTHPQDSGAEARPRRKPGAEVPAVPPAPHEPQQPAPVERPARPPKPARKPRADTANPEAKRKARPKAEKAPDRRMRAENIPAGPRAGALALIAAVRSGATLSEAAGLLEHLSPAERARAQRLAAETLRHAGRVEATLAPLIQRRPRPEVMDILALATTEMLALGEAPHGVVNAAVALARGGSPKVAAAAGMVNAVRRRAAEAGGAGAAATPSRMPGWLRGPVAAAWGEAAARAIEAAHERAAPIDLSGKPGAELPGERLPTGSHRLPPGSQVTAQPGYDAGDWWVQDAAAALPVMALDPRPGERIADLCAAPGGKTMQIAAAGAAVTAIDLSAARLARVEENLSRTGLSATLVAGDALDWRPEAALDGVLLDAPCSATGTIRRHPELPLIRDGGGIADLTALQAALIDHALTLLRPGGRLVYAVCSLLPAEGEDQLAAALSRHPALRVERPDLPGIEPAWITEAGGLRLRPDYWSARGGMDGFFIARLVRDA